MIFIHPSSGKDNDKEQVAHSIWISYSDMMAALMLLFVLVLTYSIYQYFTLLEMQLTTPETVQIKSEVQAAVPTPTAAEATPATEPAKAAAATPSPQQATAAPTTTAQATITTTKVPPKSEQATTDTDAKQLKATELVDVRTSIINDLGASLSTTDIHAVVNTSTGDITLESEVFFDYNSNTIKRSGQEFLLKFIPVYIDVLLDPLYSDYIGEIIIEGHTDTNGAYLYNLELSQNRAFAVAKYCLEQTDLTKEQLGKLQTILAAKGCSYSNPIHAKDGSVDQDASRRVEFKFRLKDADMLDELNTALDKGD